MVVRSKELWMVAYFLSKYAEKTGTKTSYPPKELQTLKWVNAYRMFYDAIGGGRTIDSFVHSLKNTRDTYDSHLDSNRVGWLDDRGLPNKLNAIANKTFARFSKLSRAEIWDEIHSFADFNLTTYQRSVNDLAVMQNMDEINDKSSKTEGGLRIIISTRYERNISLRNAAFKIHGYNCAVCGFNFGKTYGDWGRDFGEVHHLVPVSEKKGGKQVVDPHSDLIVLCPNCHRMVHRKRGITLTVEELKMKLNSLD